MGEHLELYVKCLARPGTAQLGLESSSADPSGSSPPAVTVDGPTATATTTTDPSSDTVSPSRPASDEGRLDHHDSSDEEEEPLIQMAECRICQEEDCLKILESPCACSGSLKTYQPGYTPPPPPPQSEETAIDIGGWTISGAPLELDPRLLAIAETFSGY